MTKNIATVLHDIQTKLKAPKNQRNNFGNYNYRSCEDVLEAVKPLLPAGYSLILNDEIKAVGDRVYVEATAMLYKSPEESIKTTAQAREAESKKGMDAAQVTGAASSYARKYALSGLFAIDDNKDADTKDNNPPSDEDRLDPDSPDFDPRFAAKHTRKRLKSFDNPAGLNSYWKQPLVKNRIASIYEASEKAGNALAETYNEQKETLDAGV